MILGIDEVGRGCWAGPLVVGACVLPNDHRIKGLTDSKKLTAKKRLVLFDQIKKEALDYGLGWVSNQEIDQIGLSESLKLATFRAVNQIKSDYDQIIIDGTINFLSDKPQFRNISTLKKADLLIPSVSAAAILAKVSRDQHMIELSDNKKYSNYGFDKHVGYGTKLHRQLLEQCGVSDIHRASFRPIQELLGERVIEADVSETTKVIGDFGEEEASRYLLNNSFEVLTRNWRTRLFEIDIVAKKDNIIYLVEVKTRKNDDFGGGIAAIDEFKFDKMKLAAQSIEQKYPDNDIRQLIITVTGDKIDYRIELIEI